MGSIADGIRGLQVTLEIKKNKGEKAREKGNRKHSAPWRQGGEAMGSQDKCLLLGVLASATGGDHENGEADDDLHDAFP